MIPFLTALRAMAAALMQRPVLAMTACMNIILMMTMIMLVDRSYTYRREEAERIFQACRNVLEFMNKVKNQ